jgi:hypothetical protein
MHRGRLFAFPYNLNLDDQLFKYGVRIIGSYSDAVSGKYPIVVGAIATVTNYAIDWPFFRW